MHSFPVDRAPSYSTSLVQLLALTQALSLHPVAPSDGWSSAGTGESEPGATDHLLGTPPLGGSCQGLQAAACGGRAALGQTPTCTDGPLLAEVGQDPGHWGIQAKSAAH